MTGWNVLVYANADGGPAEAGIRQAVVDLGSIVLPADCNVVVQLNTALAREMYWFSKGQRQIQELSRIDTADGASLTRFINQRI